MNDEQIEAQIERLVAEEHSLLERGERGEADAESHERLEAVRVELDRQWDLLRQRQAREEVGLDPDDASIRDARTVEGYQG